MFRENGTLSSRENTKSAFHLFIIQYFKNMFCCGYLHSCVLRCGVCEVFCTMFQLSVGNYCAASLSAEDLTAVSF